MKAFVPAMFSFVQELKSFALEVVQLASEVKSFVLRVGGYPLGWGIPAEKESDYTSLAGRLQKAIFWKTKNFR
jgi:hypothetical protein